MSEGKFVRHTLLVLPKPGGVGGLFVLFFEFEGDVESGMAHRHVLVGVSLMPSF